MRCLAHTTASAAISLALVFASGCHSAYVQATVINRTSQPVHLFEVDYPSASFGGNELQAGSTFHYRFKILGSGPAKILWTDAAEHDHTATGPNLSEGEEGALSMTIAADGVHWAATLHDASHP